MTSFTDTSQVYMSTQKKRRLDLGACEQAISAGLEIEKTCTALRNIPLSSNSLRAIRHDEDAVLTLMAKYGIAKVCQLQSVLSKLPSSLTDQQRKHLVSQHIPGSDFEELTQLLLTSTSNVAKILSDTVSLSAPTVLAPPTKRCLTCKRQLTSNHSCTVRVYTLIGVEMAQKFTLRCCHCSLSYNYAHWGDKHKSGFFFYDEARPLVEVSDTVYFDRQLMEMQCSLA